MGENSRKLEIAKDIESDVAVKAETGKKRSYVDPKDSAKTGFAGLLETAMRNFKTALHLILILPVYMIGCCALGLAAAPGIFVFESLSALAPAGWMKYPVLGATIAASYFTYGFALLFVVPFLNFLLRCNVKPWRGPYYSIEAIRWYVHNGFTYLVRYTFLEFVTPTPFNILFYKMMGMKIGKGTAINSTWISDPSLIELGEKCTIGGSVHLIAHYGQGGYLVLAPLKIGDRVTIGLKATVMGGVTIGANAKVMPNSVVMPKTVIPEGETWGGVPARKID